MLEACKYWQGYTAQRAPKCNNGQGCVQCRSKFIESRGWKNTSGMWISPHDNTAYLLAEAFQKETVNG